MSLKTLCKKNAEGTEDVDADGKRWLLLIAGIVQVFILLAGYNSIALQQSPDMKLLTMYLECFEYDTRSTVTWMLLCNAPLRHLRGRW